MAEEGKELQINERVRVIQGTWASKEGVICHGPKVIRRRKPAGRVHPKYDAVLVRLESGSMRKEMWFNRKWVERVEQAAAPETERQETKNREEASGEANLSGE